MTRPLWPTPWLALGALLALGTGASAQSLSRQQIETLARVRGVAPGLPGNAVSHIRADGSGRVWVATGGGLAVTTDGGQTFRDFRGDPAFPHDGFPALDVRGDTIWASQVYTRRVDIPGEGEQNFQAGGGFAYSVTGGADWTYVGQPLDLPNNDRKADSLDFCGAKVAVLPIIVPEQNVTYDLAVGDTAIWIASWASGLRWRHTRSTDNVSTSWNRVLLPLDGQAEIVCGAAGNDTLLNAPAGKRLKYDPRPGDRNNLKAFSVLLSASGRIYAGTAGGINLSADGRSWRNITHLNQTRPISGDWTIALREQLTARDTTIWAATWSAERASERFGVSYSRDGGDSWTQTLLGTKASDFAFSGDTVYVASDAGLFTSTDGGRTWTGQTAFADRDGGPSLRPAAVYAVETVRSGELWAGADAGLLRSLDGGLTWTILRRAEALQGGGDSKAVSTYAFPNPFAPDDDSAVRFHYALPQSGAVTIRIFNYSMQPVRTVVSGAERSAGEQTDPVGWDGRDAFGARVANGVYFYAITGAGMDAAWGKILVLE